MSHVELAEIILDESGYTEMWQNDKTPEAPGRLENLKELVKALEQFENLQGFLEHVGLIMDNDKTDADEKGQHHDPACGQGAGISCRVFARMGRRAVSVAALMDESGHEGPRGRTAACLCRDHAGRGDLHHFFRGQPPCVWPMAEPDAEPLY